MKYVVVAAMCFALMACQGNTQDKVQLKTQKDSVSYAIGLDVGRRLKQQKVEVDPDIFAKGFKDIATGAKPALSDSQSQGVIAVYQQQAMAKQNEELKVQAEKNKKESEAFLAENKKKDSIVVLPSGLQYKILRKGSGKKPKAEDVVSVNYRGTLMNGTEFDNSYKHGEVAKIPVSGVMKGWSEAIQLMPVGSKWVLYIPPDLAYGERGAGQVIPPNAALIFEVELVEDLGGQHPSTPH